MKYAILPIVAVFFLFTFFVFAHPVFADGDSFTQKDREMLVRLDERLKQIDKRFEQIEK